VSSLTDTEARLATESDRWRGLDALFARLESDMRAAQPREVRAGGTTEPAWTAGTDALGNAEFRLSRAGPEFVLELGSVGQRIGYRLRNGAIEVLYWPHFDMPADVAPIYPCQTASPGFAIPAISTAGAAGTIAGRCSASPQCHGLCVSC
jgi:hypothetical protein